MIVFETNWRSSSLIRVCTLLFSDWIRNKLAQYRFDHAMHNYRFWWFIIQPGAVPAWSRSTLFGFSTGLCTWFSNWIWSKLNQFQPNPSYIWFSDWIRDKLAQLKSDHCIHCEVDVTVMIVFETSWRSSSLIRVFTILFSAWIRNELAQYRFDNDVHMKL